MLAKTMTKAKSHKAPDFRRLMASIVIGALLAFCIENLNVLG